MYLIHARSILGLLWMVPYVNCTEMERTSPSHLRRSGLYRAGVLAELVLRRRWKPSLGDGEFLRKSSGCLDDRAPRLDPSESAPAEWQGRVFSGFDDVGDMLVHMGQPAARGVCITPIEDAGQG